MGQGILGGMTPYDMQSLKDIQEDILVWSKYSKKIQTFFKETLEFLNTEEYLPTIPFNLKSLYFDTIQILETFIYDLNKVYVSISQDNITEKEVKLLRNIGSLSIENNSYYGQTYHRETRWQDYDDSNFRLAEKMYQKGRDLFVTLQDVGNAAKRLEDYVNVSSTNNFIVNGGTGHQIQQGSGTNMTMNVVVNSGNTEKVNELINELIEKLDEYFDGDIEKKQEAKEYIEVVQGQLVEAKPKQAMLKTALKGLKTLSDSTSFISNISNIAQNIGILL